VVTIVEPLELSLAADRPRLEALRVRMATHIPCSRDPDGPGGDAAAGTVGSVY